MPAVPPPTAVVADGQPLFRVALVHALRRAGVRVLGETGDARRAAELVRSQHPDVVLVDAHLADAQALLAVRGNGTRVALLSGCGCEEELRRAQRLGAAGVLARTRDAAGFADAVARVARGERVVDGAEADDGGRFARDDGDRPLTPRERDVLRLMAEGRSGPEIARELYVSPSTVKTHTERLYEKLGVSHRGAAVAEGMRRGLVA